MIEIGTQTDDVDSEESLPTSLPELNPEVKKKRRGR